MFRPSNNFFRDISTYCEYSIYFGTLNLPINGYKYYRHFSAFTKLIHIRSSIKQTGPGIPRGQPTIVDKPFQTQTHPRDGHP